MAIAVVMIVTVLAMPFLAGRQTPSVVVNPVVIAASGASSTTGDDLTDMFLTGLTSADVLNVIDARTGEQTDADLYVNSSVDYSEEHVEVGVEDVSERGSVESIRRFRTEVTSVQIDISVADSSGKVFFSEGRVRSGIGARTVQRAAAPIMGLLADRLTKYIGIVGVPPDAKPVEGRIVTTMDSTTAVVDKGRKAGLAPGDEVEVRRGDVVTNADGEVIFSRLKTIGKAEVGEVQDEGALITAADSLELEEGDTVVRIAPVVPEPSVAEQVETGHALYDAFFYRQAAREYLAALDSDGELLDVLFPLAVAQMKTGDHDAAYESFARFLDAGQRVDLDATHGHTFGSCDGMFTLTREYVSYRSPREDDPDHRFDVPLERVVESQMREPRVTPAEGPVFENLVLRAPSAEHIEKKKDDSKNWTIIFDVQGENTEFGRIVNRYIRSQGR